MSTFKGIVDEFPRIRIDYFRNGDNEGERPLACFLSHVHSDHIQGLEGAYNSPFIYCSAATKELLVRLERRTHRYNQQKGIIEARECIYGNKKKLLRAIPLDTPTWVEVGLEKIRVTLLDANHCVGAVMFLIEGNGKAILYTGDIRAEEWWIGSLKNHPVLLPYTTGIKNLDKIYLDTSWGYRGCHQFASKREGITELLTKMSRYPSDTVFHLNTWTFGYEEVWTALAAAFNTQIHLGPYHYRLFKSVEGVDKWAGGPYLCGFTLGNSKQQSVFTQNPDVRIHSCETKVGCDGLKGKKVVYITPIVARISGAEYNEAGIGFGDFLNNEEFTMYGQVRIVLDILGPRVSSEARRLLVDASRSRNQTISLGYLTESAHSETSIQEFVERLAEIARMKGEGTINKAGDENWPGTESIRADGGELLPTWVKYPFSRHSSFSELRNFVAAFRPSDIYPCVLEEGDWTEESSVESLYGDLCGGSTFSHDEEMRRLYSIRAQERDQWEEKLEMMAEESQLRSFQSSDNGSRQELEGNTQRLERFEEMVRSKREKEVVRGSVFKGPLPPLPPLSLPQVGTGNHVFPEPRTPDPGPKRNPPTVITSALTHSPSTASEMSPPPRPGRATIAEERLIKEAEAVQRKDASSPTMASSTKESVPSSERDIPVPSQASVKRQKTGNHTWSILPAASQDHPRHIERLEFKEPTQMSIERSCHLAPKSSESAGGNPVSQGSLIELDSSLDVRSVTEAVYAAIGWDGRTWFDIELDCVHHESRCQEEHEL